MRSLKVLSSLPSGYSVVEGRGGVLALWNDTASALEGAGFGLASDGDVAPSDLAAGRRRMNEIVTPVGRFVVRRFTHGGLARWMTGERFLDPERPFREIVLSDRLMRIGIATPRVVAARALRATGGGFRLVLITRRIEGSMTLAQFLEFVRRGGVRREALGPVLETAGRLVRRLHDNGFIHADLTTSNMLVERDSLLGAEPRAWIIDLDGSRVIERVSDDERRRTLRRLYRHVERRDRDGIGALNRSAFARFMRGYDPERTRWKRDWSAIAESHRRRRLMHGLGWFLENRFAKDRPEETPDPPSSTTLNSTTRS